jgi:hypothetical protein
MIVVNMGLLDNAGCDVVYGVVFVYLPINKSLGLRVCYCFVMIF